MVEWDQRDPDFYEFQTVKLVSQLNALKKAGLKNSQIIGFIKSNSSQNEIDAVIQSFTVEKMNDVDSNKYLLETMKRTYMSGASWSGDAVLVGVVGVVAIFIFLSIGKSIHGCLSDGRKCDNND